MTRSTFILIICLYGFLLGVVMLFLPAVAVSQYGGNASNMHGTSTMQFFGVLHLSYNFVVLAIRKSADTAVVKSYLLGVAFVCFASFGLGLYYISTGQLPWRNSYVVDCILWLSMGTGSLYFWNKEK
jgi:hypothetical protein